MFKNIRFYVLICSLILVLIEYWVVLSFYTSERLQTIRLTQYFALTAITYLYLTLLIGPFVFVFHKIPFKNQLLKARRALGISTLIFSGLHVYLAFFKQLGGLAGLAFLSNNYLLAVSFGFVALIIFSVMATTSLDLVIARIKYRRWKMIHRLVYLAGLLILIHALMLGTHFSDLSTTIPQIFFWAMGFLMIFELNRLESFLQKFWFYPKYNLVLIIGGGLIGAGLITTMLPADTNAGFGIHALHIQLAKDAQQNTTAGNLNIPGLKGDRTKRYTVSMDKPDNILPNQPVELKFKVYDASSGNEVKLFEKVYEKLVHLIVVDQKLEFFNHIHPEQTSDSFSIQTQFPSEDRYHLYLDFQPLGAIEQQFAFTIDVGNVLPSQNIIHKPDNSLEKNFENIHVSMQADSLKASEMSVGNQKITFTLSDQQTKQPLTNLKPYLSAFGHLVMINTQTYDYLHVHPNSLIAPIPNQSGGPTVEFLPLGLYGPIKPGIYKLFAQFNPDNKLITTDFTVKVD